MKWQYNPPHIIKSLFSDFQWESKKSKVLLTFDDGPNYKTTEIILKTLNDHGIKTIFFCVGENVEKYPTLVKEILSEGHEIGNHTFNHKRITTLNNIELEDTIGKFQTLLLGKDYLVKFFRPPHGRFNFQTRKILEKYSLKNVMWSLLTYDYKNNLNIVKFALSKYLLENSIVVLHDSDKSKSIIEDSIKLIVEEVQRKNFQMGIPSECLR